MGESRKPLNFLNCGAYDRVCPGNVEFESPLQAPVLFAFSIITFKKRENCL